MTQNIIVRYPLTDDIWERQSNGWKVDLFDIPGAQVEKIMKDGGELPRDLWDSQPHAGLIKVPRNNANPGVCLAFVRLPYSGQSQDIENQVRSLSRSKRQWQAIGIILPPAATVITALINHFSR